MKNLMRHASSFGAEPTSRKTDNFKLIQDCVNYLALEKRITPVIIDEASHMNNAVLSGLKILFNFEMDSRDRAVILLAGQPQINNTLRLNAHEPLRQRLVMNYNMEGLSKEEGRIYVTEKLKGAGCRPPVFGENAFEAFLSSADGTPRVINRICDAYLLIADAKELHTMTGGAAMQAVNDVQPG